MGDDRLAILGKNLRITDTHGAVLLAFDHREVNVGATTLKLSGEGGVRVDEALYSTVIRADPGRELM